jgi:hypothetical protein
MPGTKDDIESAKSDMPLDLPATLPSAMVCELKVYSSHEVVVRSAAIETRISSASGALLGAEASGVSGTLS